MLDDEPSACWADLACGRYDHHVLCWRQSLAAGNGRDRSPHFDEDVQLLSARLFLTLHTICQTCNTRHSQSAAPAAAQQPISVCLPQAASKNVLLLRS